MATIDLWFEGAYHPFGELRQWYSDFFEASGHRVRTGSLVELLDHDDTDLMVFGGLAYSDMPGGYQPLTNEEFGRFLSRLDRGIPLLGLHCVIGCFDDRPEMREIWDGLWNWGHSDHSPAGESFEVVAVPGSHPLVQGIDSFTTRDELYYNLIEPTRCEVVLEAEYAGKRWPLGWAGSTRNSPYIYLGLGHDVTAVSVPEFGRLLHNAAAFLLAAPVGRR